MTTIVKQGKHHSVTIGNETFVLTTNALGGLGLWLNYQYNVPEAKHLSIGRGLKEANFNGFFFHHPTYKSVHVGGMGIVLQRDSIPEFVKQISDYAKKYKLFAWDLPLVDCYGPVKANLDSNDPYADDTVMLVDDKFYTVVNHHDESESTHFPVALMVSSDDTFMHIVKGTPNVDPGLYGKDDQCLVEYSFADSTEENRI